MAHYQNTSILCTGRKFSEAESAATLLYQARSHQINDNADEVSLPLFAILFFQYFDFSKLGTR